MAPKRINIDAADELAADEARLRAQGRLPKKKLPPARETLVWVSKALELTVHELAETKEKLAQADALLKSGEATMLENAKVVVELSEALTTARAELAMKELQLSNSEGIIRALEAQNAFWQEEAERLRYDLLLHIAEAARNKKPAGPPPEPAGSPPGPAGPPRDDAKEIEALQDLALRGGVA